MIDLLAAPLWARDRLEDLSNTTSEIRDTEGKSTYSDSGEVPGLKKLTLLRWLELMYNPRNQVEAFVGKFIHVTMPYLNWITYRFHVEKAREGGKQIFFN